MRCHRLPLALCAWLTLCACSVPDDGAWGGTRPQPMLESQLSPLLNAMGDRPLARGLTLSELRVSQAVTLPLLRDGAWVPADERPVPLVIERDLLVQLGWDLDPDFESRDLEGVLVVRTAGHETVYTQRKRTWRDADFSDFEGAFSWVLDGALIQPDTQLSVGIYEVDHALAPDEADHAPRFPAQGMQALEPWPEALTLDYVLVPAATTCVAAPTLSAEEKQNLESYIYNLLPLSRLNIVYHDPLQLETCNEGEDFLGVLTQLRDAEGRGPRAHYQGILATAVGEHDPYHAGYGRIIDSDKDQRADRVSYFRILADLGLSNAVHELGHNFGAHHTFGKDRDYSPALAAEFGGIPSAGFALRPGRHPRWSGAEILYQIIPPSFPTQLAAPQDGDGFFDVMSYHQPYWVSEHNYLRFARRLRALSQLPSGDVGGAPLSPESGLGDAGAGPSPSRAVSAPADAAAAGLEVFLSARGARFAARRHPPSRTRPLSPLNNATLRLRDGTSRTVPVEVYRDSDEHPSSVRSPLPAGVDADDVVDVALHLDELGQVARQAHRAPRTAPPRHARPSEAHRTLTPRIAAFAP